uniref:Uncharacterized protein n=1 Tax=Arundo donax TaxID=35708 RepID=A0A0A9TYT0_ARUDO
MLNPTHFKMKLVLLLRSRILSVQNQWAVI